MKRPILFVYAFGTIIMLLGCALQESQLNPSGAESLNQTELEHLFNKERSVEFFSKETRVDVKYFPDGRQEIDWGAGSDKGTFRINNGEFCSTWTWLRKGAESCSKVYKISDTEFEFRSSDGASHAIMHLK
jgi:hypothetical protein